MSGRLLVLDFDGTMTDAEEEGLPFRGGYLEDIAALVNQPVAAVLALADRFEAEVASRQGEFGWVFGAASSPRRASTPTCASCPSPG